MSGGGADVAPVDAPFCVPFWARIIGEGTTASAMADAYNNTRAARDRA
jgi:hypothetical protein